MTKLEFETYILDLQEIMLTTYIHNHIFKHFRVINKKYNQDSRYICDHMVKDSKLKKDFQDMFQFGCGIHWAFESNLNDLKESTTTRVISLELFKIESIKTKAYLKYKLEYSESELDNT